ncbi:hypothetical protein [Mycobacterium hubeiense]|uniref:hypothetical protein n=1 Tax=Mycobacterium hubeiense TaxID=1867256 RepID=UPI000C7F040F|nr:hypothetical protein [Mycobacterium sp. QGD 101]
MRALLEFFLKYLDFLYLDPQYRIVDSKTGGERINASLKVQGTDLTWSVVNDRGQMQLSVSPTRLSTSDSWFWISLIRQYVEGHDEIQYLPVVEEIEWARANLDPIARLFSDPSTVEATCDALRALRRANADKTWGPAR